MRSAARKKLHSRRGASLLIALLFFLTAMAVGAVVLTAAATNAGRFARSRQEQQDYLAVASAAGLIEKDFQGSALKLGYTKTHIKEDTITTSMTGGGSGSSTGSEKTIYAPIDGHGSLSGGSELLPEGHIIDLYEDGIKTAVQAIDFWRQLPYGTELKDDLSVEVQHMPGAAKLPAVAGTMTVSRGPAAGDSDRTYTVIVKLRTAGGEDGASPTNAMTLKFAPSIDLQTTTKVEEKTERRYYTTEHGEDLTETKTTVTTVTTCTTTISWGQATFTKGAAI